MPRERREFKRESFQRSVQRLFVIASEGTKSEIKYFEEFKSEEYYNNQSVFVEVLNRLSTSSSPSFVIKQLNAFAREYRIKPDDELWMIIDRDKQSWKPREIADVARQCIQKGYGFALSNPSFEAWLLLHHRDYRTYNSGDQAALFENAKIGTRTRLESELVAICGSYDKSNLNVSHYLPHVQNAISNAEAIVVKPNERWPSMFGTHIYKLVVKLLPPNV